MHFARKPKIAERLPLDHGALRPSALSVVPGKMPPFRDRNHRLGTSVPYDSAAVRRRVEALGQKRVQCISTYSSIRRSM